MSAFDERMQQLRTRFEERSVAERGELESALAAGDHGGAIRILHSLAGNAGMFGFPGLSAAARQLEAALEGGAPEGETAPMLRQVMNEHPRAACAGEGSGSGMREMRSCPWTC